MADQFDALVQTLIGVEGGYSNNPADPGKETIWGITIGVARENGYTGAMRDMTQAQAITIYRAKYWAKPGLYLISPLSAKIAAELFDTGVNQGTGTAGMMFQRMLNVLNRKGADYPDIRVDGAIGGGTAAAFTAYLKRNPAYGESVMLKGLNGLQLAHYVEIAEHDPNAELFENGWIANRVGIPA